MYCLGIETSCDETSVSVVQDGQQVLSHVVQTQVELHRVYGGVVPEIACRAHIETLLPVMDSALRRAGLDLNQIDLICVTHTPGLIGALLVGLSAAKTLSLVTGKPLVGVDHLHAHIYASKMVWPELEYPSISLVVSGGHTSLYLSHSQTQHELLGCTIDDAAGEAFDKVAKVLGLPFPGGPSIEKAALGGDPGKIDFPRTFLEPGSLDFSFSGIKTAVLYYVKGQNAKRPRRLSEQDLKDIAASFQEAMVDMLIEKTLMAAQRLGLTRITIGGGVACNKRLREKFHQKVSNAYQVYYPPREFCLDNAAMVAGLGFHLFKAGYVSDLTLDAAPTARPQR
jgi:N6-L-threonylcarbamoyladenine synthase